MSKSATSPDVFRDKADAARAEIARVREEIASLQRRVDVLSGEANAFDVAWKLLSEPMSNSPLGATLAKLPASLLSEAYRSSESDKRRGPRGAWRFIFPELLKRYGEKTFRFSDVESASKAAGYPVSGSNIRGPLSNYTKQGYVERVKNGVFKITAEGRATITSLSANEEAAPPEVEDAA